MVAAIARETSLIMGSLAGCHNVVSKVCRGLLPLCCAPATTPCTYDKDRGSAWACQQFRLPHTPRVSRSDQNILRCRLKRQKNEFAWIARSQLRRWSITRRLRRPYQGSRQTWTHWPTFGSRQVNIANDTRPISYRDGATQGEADKREALQHHLGL